MEEQRKLREKTDGKSPEQSVKDEDDSDLELKREEEEEDRLEGLGSGNTSVCGHIRYYLLQLWDGLGFFGFDDTKLDRLIGKPLDFLTKLSSVRWFILTFGTFALIFYAMF